MIVHGGRGYASRLVSELTAEILGDGARPTLYTRLENPISNRIYQRIGSRPVGEHVRYEFDLSDDQVRVDL